MKKAQLEIELQKFLDELIIMEQQTKLGAASVKFLTGETDKLLVKNNDSNLSYSEKEKVLAQMDAMYLRLEKEKELLREKMAESKSFDDRFEKLRNTPVED